VGRRSLLSGAVSLQTEPDCIAVFLRLFDEKTYAIYKTAPPPGPRE
jgi:hypothetical protein